MHIISRGTCRPTECYKVGKMTGDGGIRARDLQVETTRLWRSTKWIRLPYFCTMKIRFHGLFTKDTVVIRTTNAQDASSMQVILDEEFHLEFIRSGSQQSRLAMSPKHCGSWRNPSLQSSIVDSETICGCSSAPLAHPLSHCKPENTKQLPQHLHLYSSYACNTTNLFHTHIFIWLILSLPRKFFSVYFNVMAWVLIIENEIVHQLVLSRCSHCGFSRNIFNVSASNNYAAIVVSDTVTLIHRQTLSFHRR